MTSVNLKTLEMIKTKLIMNIIQEKEETATDCILKMKRRIQMKPLLPCYQKRKLR